MSILLVELIFLCQAGMEQLQGIQSGELMQRGLGASCKNISMISHGPYLSHSQPRDDDDLGWLLVRKVLALGISPLSFWKEGDNFYNL